MGHPIMDPAGAVVDFQDRLGFERQRQSLEARRGVDAATHVRDQAIRTGKVSVNATTGFVGETITGVGSAACKFTVDLVRRTRSWRENEPDAE